MEELGHKVAELRINYEKGNLHESDMFPDPILQFEKWFQEAQGAKIKEPNAMCLCTASKSGFPSGRMVLLKCFDQKGFVFYTNYQSRKSKELTDNPKACLVFFWESIERSVRIEGIAEKVSEAESEEYFHSRPKKSQLGAWASPNQSGVVRCREEIDDRYGEVEEKFKDSPEIPKPEFWGGWRIKPLALEFWQGRESRLHDRIVYSKEKEDSSKWSIQRLSP